MTIPFIDLQQQFRLLEPSIRARIDAVLAHGQYIMGPEVAELEESLARFVGVKHCVTVANGSDALLVALMAIGIEAGDEVITTPFTFFATAEMIALLGALPVFVDIDPRTYNIDSSKIEAAITKRTKAIMPVSLYGQCAEFDEINRIARKFGLPVIEDAAQSFGATYKGKKSCSLSLIGCTSFFPSKPLGCYGDGGACFTDDDELARQMRQIRTHGQDRRYHHLLVGINGRMDTLQCAVVLAKLPSFPDEVSARSEIGARYSALLEGVSDRIVIPFVESHNTSVYAQYTIQVDNRELVQQNLQTNGVPTVVHYPTPVHLQPAFRWLHLAEGSFPVAEAISRRVMSLPMHPYVDERHQEFIADKLTDITRQT